MDFLQGRLKEISPLDRPRNPRVWHFFFELGYGHNNLAELIDESDLLAIELEFQDVRSKDPKSVCDFAMGPVRPPSFSQYSESFNQVRAHLLRGDCYQVNLTFPFEASFQGNLEGMLARLWRDRRSVGAYAHATSFPSLGKSFVSQSPECLFQLQEQGEHFILQTMPIKGSLKLRREDVVDFKWQELVKNKKDEGELFMIVDLLRNDLNRIERPLARVLRKKAPLVVPGILHQYALIETMLSHQVTLDKIMIPLFPGGSVTGAPKRRAMEIIHSLESERRGLYCGTTFIQHRDIFRGNINIRTAEIHYPSLNIRYFAGGGITLLSDVYREYWEMLAKAESFFNLF